MIVPVYNNNNNKYTLLNKIPRPGGALQALASGAGGSAGVSTASRQQQELKTASELKPAVQQLIKMINNRLQPGGGPTRRSTGTHADACNVSPALEILCRSVFVFIF